MVLKPPTQRRLNHLDRIFYEVLQFEEDDSCTSMLMKPLTLALGQV